MRELMDTNTNIQPHVFIHAAYPGGKIRLHLLVLTLLVVLLFVASSGLWTGAAFSEALFFSGLKGGQAYGNFPLPTQKLFELLAATADNGSLWPLRIFSAACAWLILLVVYFGSRAFYGANAAFLAALVLLTTPFFERFAIMGLPYMWQAALISSVSAMALAARTTQPWSWLRATSFLFLSLLSLCFGGVAVLGAILPLLLCYFLTLKSKRQLIFSRRIILPGMVFIIMLAALFCEAALRAPDAWFSLKLAGFDADAIQGFVLLSKWKPYVLTLLNILGLWILAPVVIILWALRQKLRRKPANLPYWKQLGVWLIAALLAALFWPYDNAGRFLSLLPPLAIFIGYYLDRYARYRNSRPRSRATLKANAITLKFLLTLWGLAICGCGIWLIFNLEQAWQRQFYLETGHLVFLIALGVLIIILSVRSFWIIGRVYSYWGFIVAMLLSFSFIGYGVVVPSRDIVYTPYYFNRNLKTLLPAIETEGVTLGVLPRTDRNVVLARFFLYADYPVHFVALNRDNFKDLASALPTHLAVTSDMLANLGQTPYEAGYRPVFWEEVAGTLLIVLERFAETDTQGLHPLLNLANTAEAADWLPGYCLAGGYLIPYDSQGNMPAFSTQVAVYPDYNLRIINAVIDEGIRDPYIFRWLTAAGRAAPKGAYTGLALHFKTPYINKHWPYGVRFQQWVMEEILSNVQPSFTAFTGLNPEHGRTKRVLKKLLQPEKVRNAAVSTVVNRIDFEWLTTTVFLRFYAESAYSLTLEVPLRK